MIDLCSLVYPRACYSIVDGRICAILSTSVMVPLVDACCFIHDKLGIVRLSDF